MVAFVRLKVSVVPVKGVVEITVPSATRDTELIPVEEAPVSVRVKLLKVTLLLPGLVSWICCTVTPAAPGIWVELFGGLDPCEACTITTVGVKVNVTVEVGLWVAVEVVVRVAVFVKMLVAVKVAV
jgi:hypothetical protein